MDKSNQLLVFRASILFCDITMVIFLRLWRVCSQILVWTNPSCRVCVVCWKVGLFIMLYTERFWLDVKNKQQIFINFAKEQQFDYLNPRKWYEADLTQIPIPMVTLYT